MASDEPPTTNDFPKRFPSRKGKCSESAGKCCNLQPSHDFQQKTTLKKTEKGSVGHSPTHHSPTHRPTSTSPIASLNSFPSEYCFPYVAKKIAATKSRRATCGRNAAPANRLTVN